MKGFTVAWSFHRYHAQACKGPVNEMETKDGENAMTACHLLAYNEMFAGK